MYIYHGFAEGLEVNREEFYGVYGGLFFLGILLIPAGILMGLIRLVWSAADKIILFLDR